MKSKTSIHSLSVKLHNDYPSDSDLTKSTKIVGSKIVIGSINESSEIHELEVDADISTVDIISINNIISFIATTYPGIDYYANSWVNTFINDSDFTPENILSTVEVKQLISVFSDGTKRRLNSLNDIELLFTKVSHAIKIFEPLIFIEEGLLKQSFAYILNQPTLLKQLRKNAISYKKYVAESNLICILKRYINSLPIGSANKNNIIDISRAHYALLIMVLSELPDGHHSLAFHFCKNFIYKHKKEKKTRTITKILSIIVYRLLMHHSKGIKYNETDYRGDAGKIITSFAQKNSNGDPYYIVDERFVEKAVTKN
jgi:hypothetical protein